MAEDGFDSAKYFRIVSDLSSALVKSKDYQDIVKTLLDCWRKRGTIFTIGCGGSASTASHFAADLAKATITKGKPRLKAIALVDNIPLVSAWTNDSGWESVFAEQLEPWLTKKDVLVCFSVHGGRGKGDAGPWSENLVAAMKLAKERKAKIIGFSGFDGGEIKKMADFCIIIPNRSKVYGTPLIEAMHAVIHHGLIFELKERIKRTKS